MNTAARDSATRCPASGSGGSMASTVTTAFAAASANDARSTPCSASAASVACDETLPSTTARSAPVSSESVIAVYAPASPGTRATATSPDSTSERAAPASEISDLHGIPDGVAGGADHAGDGLIADNSDYVTVLVVPSGEDGVRDDATDDDGEDDDVGDDEALLHHLDGELALGNRRSRGWRRLRYSCDGLSEQVAQRRFVEGELVHRSGGQCPRRMAWSSVPGAMLRIVRPPV